MYNKETKLIRKKVFWYLLLRCVWISPFDIKIEIFKWISIDPLWANVYAIHVSFNTSKATVAMLQELPITPEDVNWLSEAFAKAYIRYKLKKSLLKV